MMENPEKANLNEMSEHEKECRELVQKELDLMKKYDPERFARLTKFSSAEELVEKMAMNYVASPEGLEALRDRLSHYEEIKEMNDRLDQEGHE